MSDIIIIIIIIFLYIFKIDLIIMYIDHIKLTNEDRNYIHTRFGERNFILYW